MGFTIRFLLNLGELLLEGAPLFVGLAVLISGVAIVVGRREGWSLGESIYFGFITATTVGYGDYRPTTRLGRTLAVMLAFLGLIFTGIMVAIAVEAATLTHGELRP